MWKSEIIYAKKFFRFRPGVNLLMTVISQFGSVIFKKGYAYVLGSGVQVDHYLKILTFTSLGLTVITYLGAVVHMERQGKGDKADDIPQDQLYTRRLGEKFGALPGLCGFGQQSGSKAGHLYQQSQQCTRRVYWGSETCGLCIVQEDQEALLIHTDSHMQDNCIWERIITAIELCGNTF